MIDTTVERPYPLDLIPEEQVPGRGGRKVHIRTLESWISRGIRGIYLESIMIGGIICTSLQALSRFHVAVTEAKNSGRRPMASNPRTDRERGRDNAAARRKLQAAGVNLEPA